MAAAGLNALVILILSLQWNVGICVCVFGVLVNTATGATNGVRDWSWSEPDLAGHRDDSLLQSNDFRHIKQHHDGAADSSTLKAQAETDAVSGADSLTTEMRIARLHEQFQQHNQTNAGAKVRPSSPFLKALQVVH